MIKNVVVAGGGVLGSQIALQTAVSGFKVTVYDISEDSLQASKEKMEGFIPRYQEESKKDFGRQALDQALADIIFTTDLKEAAQDADLVVESIPENFDIKHEFYEELSNLAQEDTIFATNTSSFLPSDLKEFTGRPDRFVALHFANEIWKRNLAEVMRTDDTDNDVYETIKQFARDIGMVPIELNFEKAGYILNSLLIPLLNAAKELLGKGIAKPEVIDKTWMKAGRLASGPFGIIDMIGLGTELEITKSQYEESHEEWQKNYLDVIEEKVQRGETGKDSGKGFYEYPNPAFEAENFFDNPAEIKDLKHDFKKIMIAGAGVLGSQIAYLTAAAGFDAILYDISDEALESGKEKLQSIVHQYSEDMDVPEDQAVKYLDRISLTSDIKEAADDVDLVIEAVSENPEIKRSFYGDLADVLPEKAYIATNTSTLLPSDLEDMTDRPEKFAALHFANRIWKQNTGEVMPGSKTSDDFFDKLQAFSRDIQLMVLPLRKEKDGYILNSILIPHLVSALDLLASGAADVETIDKTWMIFKYGDESKAGPFSQIDRIGLETMKNIVEIRKDKAGNEEERRSLINILDLLDEKIAKNETGMAVGKGFYEYPNPAYEADDFLEE
ncbi:3-hydroxybutyryl-CoA dehydrogenase [Alloiococcus otitis]|uniref:3-hydroxyacyl-CoA dehydrogenase n=1 Tax=Alloiococcus otitis ATCC 51267 TaxID=883081 RepID=K9ED46_9LACT|nr:3-hydroxyacyl-CoA dehydrogenase [Alloiococcus otitis]EKU93766.1 hypothetical protein HMPREF9698_00714 [Alloiococcus otitis ATCC 51267]SUU80194.1 3-hydroxybutyryl-CoA dehydrogenase [Alloiococcus otitis]